MKKVILIVSLLLVVVLSSCKMLAKDKEVDLDKVKENLKVEFYKEKLVIEAGSSFDYENAIKSSNGIVTPIQDMSQVLTSPGEYEFTFLIESAEYPEVSKIIEVLVSVIEAKETTMIPKFEGVKESYVFEQGTVVNLYKGVNVRDYHGDIIPFEVIGEWSNMVIGEYEVTFLAVDSEGNEAMIRAILQIVPSDSKGGDVETEAVQQVVSSNAPILCLNGEDPTKECDWIPRSKDVAKSNLFLFTDHDDAFAACAESGANYVSKFGEPGYKAQYRCINLKNNVGEEVGYELWKLKLPLNEENK